MTTGQESTASSQADPPAQAAPAQGTSASGPVRESDRITSLDVLRGFALLGILTMNIGSFSMPSATYFNPTAYGDLTGSNLLVYQITHVFGDLKFMAIFSMLFGAGIVLMTERRVAAGKQTTGLHYRRMAWLLVFGLMHAHLLWYGDILVWYALCGSLVYGMRNKSPRTLITVGLLLIAVPSLLLLSGGVTMSQWPPEVMADVIADFAPSAIAIAAEVAAYQGSFSEQMAFRSPEALMLETASFLQFALWRVSGLMLLGMALFKLRVLAAERTTRFYQTLVAIALLVGVPVIVYGMNRNFASGWPVPESFFLGIHFNYWGSLLVALGWIGAVMLLCQSGRLPVLTGSLSAVGRMAFTNYILQSVICTLIFYGHGLGLFGQVERSGQAAIVLAVWAFQLIYSPVWLHYFRFGPLEWLWRSLVYVQLQPMRRASA